MKVLMRRIVPLLLLVFLVAVAYAPVLSGKWMMFNSDTLDYDYPMISFYASALRSGEAVAWNPYYMGGFPSIISPVGKLMDPLTLVLLRLFDDPFFVYHLHIVITASLGAVFAYLFGRSLKFSRPAAYILACTAVIGETVSVLTAGQVNGPPFWILPGLLFVIQSASRARSHILRWCVMGIALLSFAWMFGFAQMVLYAVVVIGFYALNIDWPNRHSPDPSCRWRSTKVYLLISVVSAAIAFPVLLPTIKFTSLTPRVAGFGLLDIDGLKIGNILNVVMPDYIEIPMIAVNRGNPLYVGALGLIFFVLGLLYYRRDRQVRFFIYALAVILLLLIPQLKLSWLMQHLPVFGMFHTLKRMLIVGVFMMAVVAAKVFDDMYMRGADVMPRLRRAVCAINIVIGTLIAFMMALQTASSLLPWRDAAWQTQVLERIFKILRRPMSSLSLPVEEYRRVFDIQLHRFFDTFDIRSWEYVMPIVLLAVSGCTIWLYVSKRLTPRMFAIVCAIIASCNVLIVHTAQYRDMVPRESYVRMPIVAKLIHEREAGLDLPNMSGFLTGYAAFRSGASDWSLAATQNEATRETLLGNRSVLHGIARIDAYEPFMTARQAKVWREVIAPEVMNVTSSVGSISEQVDIKRARFLSHVPLLSMYNVRYILSGYTLNDPRLELVRSIAVTPTFSLQLYMNNAAFGRAFVPKRVRTVKNWNDDLFGELSASSTSPIAFIECDTCDEGEETATGTVHLLERTNDQLKFLVGAEKDVWVVIASSDLPGWKATIDGFPTAIRTSNYLMQAVRVPIGEHEVRLFYDGKL